jgi:type I restriction enzyme M protein
MESAHRRIAGQRLNLDRKNPLAKEDITHLPPAQLATDILKKEQRIAEIMGNIQKLLVTK